MISLFSNILCNNHIRREESIFSLNFMLRLFLYLHIYVYFDYFTSLAAVRPCAIRVNRWENEKKKAVLIYFSHRH
jgi:hypothetical protein